MIQRMRRSSILPVLTPGSNGSNSNDLRGSLKLDVLLAFILIVDTNRSLAKVFCLPFLLDFCRRLYRLPQRVAYLSEPLRRWRNRTGGHSSMLLEVVNPHAVAQRGCRAYRASQ